MTHATFRSLARAAAASYPRRDPFARHYAYGKLTRDPVYAYLQRERLVPAGARVLDLGCGQGLLAALLLAAGALPKRYTGIDIAERDVARAQAMARHWAPAGTAATAFSVGDVRTAEFPASDVVLLLDVLHYVEPGAQEAILGRVASALAPRGTLLLRAADASGTLRFRYTEFVDRLAMRLRGRRLPRLWSRPVAQWRVELERLGFTASAVPMSSGTLFANVLLVARYDGSK